jgi:uncharacterized membrane protein HdeD (DUF308 family)
MLVQSFLLVLLSIAFFIRPDRPLPGLQTPVGLLALLQGAIYILGFLYADPFDKSQTELILGIILIAGSLYLLFGRTESQNKFSIFLSGIMLVNGFFYAAVSWNLRSEMKFWWITMLLPAYTLFVVFFIYTSLVQAISPNYFLIGWQFFWCGIAGLKLALVSRRVVEEFKKPINRFGVK